LELENKKILVTGGSGFIGSNLVKELYKSGNEIIVIDNFVEGNIGNLAPIINDIKLINRDIRDESIFRDLANENIDVIFHLAANFANEKSIQQPVLDMEVNIGATLKLLEFARHNNIDRLIYTSSSSSYGKSESFPITEDSKHNPSTPYSISKLAGEYYTLAYYKLYGLKTSSVCFFNVYGPGEYPGKYRNVIPNFISRALAGEPLKITGSGEETRDFTYVSDAVAGTILAGEKEKAKGESFNLGTGKETKIRTLAEIINRLCDNKAGIEYVRNRNWDSIDRRGTSIMKARKLLGYTPEVDLENGIAMTIEWLRGLIKI
jgi:UDP-glucose 4-epimerase